MKKLALFGIAMGLACTAMAGQAFAGSPLAGDQEVIVDGTVLSGQWDIGGVLTKVAGMSYQEIFYVDVADLALTSSSAINATTDPIQGVSLTIDGTTEAFTPSSSTVNYQTAFATSTWEMTATDGYDINTSFDIGTYAPLTFSNPYTTTVGLNIASNPNYFSSSSYQDFKYKNNDVVLAPASVFPEPSMWALMIGGVSLAGLLLRRKSETGAVAAVLG